jgi:hypothetical protein
VSKHKEKTPAPLADWELVIDQGAIPARVEVLPQTRWKRDERDHYTFRDSKGVLAEFAPGGVLSVRRLDEAPADPGPIEVGKQREARRLQQPAGWSDPLEAGK